MRTKIQEIKNTVNDRFKKVFDKLNARVLTKRLEVFQFQMNVLGMARKMTCLRNS